MPAPVSYPGTYVEETPSAAPTLVGLPTGITLFIGCATGGPRGLAVRFDEGASFQATFGAADATHTLGDAVSIYFANGGRVAWVIALDGPPGTAAFQAALAECFAAEGPVDAIDRFDLLCVPGESDPVTQVALQAICAARRAFLIADCAAEATVSSLLNGPDARLVGANASHAALYAPWVLVADPAGPRAVPPSPFVAGIYARFDAQRGVWKAPAGGEATLIGASAPTLPLDQHTSDAMTIAGIDTIRAMPASGIVLWGARTLAATDPQYRDVAVRRFLSFVESSLDAGLQWTVFEPNAEPTWTRVRASVTGFLETLWRIGAVAGSTLAQGAFVRCDRTTMTQADIDDGRLIVEIGIAPSRPAEFIVIRLAFCTAE